MLFLFSLRILLESLAMIDTGNRVLIKDFNCKAIKYII